MRKAVYVTDLRFRALRLSNLIDLWNARLEGADDPRMPATFSDPVRELEYIRKCIAKAEIKLNYIKAELLLHGESYE